MLAPFHGQSPVYRGSPWLTLRKYRSSHVGHNYRSQALALLITSQSFEQTFECSIQPSKSGVETYSIFCVLCDLDLLIDSILINGRLSWCAVKQSTSVNIIY
ncbi:hypothetical protein ACS77_17085 [Pseudomonas syringae]|uniref:Uncharacterized protein n=1 Tax=Pseudomonas syringae TaxID=317 RepID=A0A0L1MC01_PSESX|nr:hypothetical protein ACS77_17085 [Pseudomonas syringae]KNH43088.1 hypothetical protein ACS73_27830 [Pseudomonas lini]